MNKNINFVEKCKNFLTKKYNSQKTINYYLREIDWDSKILFLY
jgi:hypothetical protein